MICRVDRSFHTFRIFNRGAYDLNIKIYFEIDLCKVQDNKTFQGQSHDLGLCQDHFFFKKKNDILNFIEKNYIFNFSF